MTQVELVITGYSIIVALALARLLDGLRPALAAGAAYWVHCLWVLNKILNVLVIYWATWYFVDESINFAQFLLILGPPAIVYLQCDALLSKNPELITDWRTYFYTNRRFFFIANSILGLALLAQVQWASGQDYPAVVYILLTVLTLVSIVGALSANPRLHAVIAILAFGNLTAGFAAQLTQI